MATGFTVQNRQKKLAFMPTEDFFKISASGKIIAVADGVTRDPMLLLPKKTLFGKLKFAFYYPRPSPAAEASQIFCDTFIEVLEDHKEKEEKAIRNAFEQANSKIDEWNRDNIFISDYLLNDLAGCVAAGATIQDGVFSYGYICDCGITIFDEKGNLKFRTENQGPSKINSFIWQKIKGGLSSALKRPYEEISWRLPEARREIRERHRNYPYEKYSFGVLTGEPTALYYLRTGTQEINPNEHLIAYTDGLEEVIFSGEFSDLIRTGNYQGIRGLCKRKVKTEGTLVYYLSC